MTIEKIVFITITLGTLFSSLYLACLGTGYNQLPLWGSVFVSGVVSYYLVTGKYKDIK